MSYTITQAVIDMLTEWPVGEIRNAKEIRGITYKHLLDHGIEEVPLDDVVLRRQRERKLSFGIVSRSGSSKYLKVGKADGGLPPSGEN